MKAMFIDGGHIYLRAPNKEDLNGNWYAWLNDPVVTRYQNKGIFPNTREKQKIYFHSMIDSKNDVIFAIVEKKRGKHIGSVGLHGIDWVHRSCDLGIVIGEKKYWGKGYGKLAWNMIAYYGLKILNLHRIRATVFEGNTASFRSARASGFKNEGVMRDFFFKNGKYHSALSMSILNNEFKEFFMKGARSNAGKDR